VIIMNPNLKDSVAYVEHSRLWINGVVLIVSLITWCSRGEFDYLPLRLGRFLAFAVLANACITAGYVIDLSAQCMLPSWAVTLVRRLLLVLVIVGASVLAFVCTDWIVGGPWHEIND
jgi:hypothetical protein